LGRGAVTGVGTFKTNANASTNASTSNAKANALQLGLGAYGGPNSINSMLGLPLYGRNLSLAKN
jgi:hypothetical protein